MAEPNEEAIQILKLASVNIETGLSLLKAFRMASRNWSEEGRAGVASAIEYAEWSVEEIEKLCLSLCGLNTYDPRRVGGHSGSEDEG